MANPHMKKGAPSVNPAGRGAPFAAAEIQKAKQAAGSNGVLAYGGYVIDREQNSKLIGTRKWTEYANLISFPPVTIAVYLQNALLHGAKWTLVANEAGGEEADRGMEIAEQGLLKADLPEPWPVVVAKAGMSRFNGLSLHALGIARRPDGMVVFSDIGHRPPHTISQWLRPSPRDRFDAVLQRIEDGTEDTIPLDECIYVRSGEISDSPWGVGMLRHVHERVIRAGKYEQLEGSEYFTSMGGTVIAEAPLADLEHLAPAGSDADRTAWMNARISPLETIVRDRVKTPEKQIYAVLDSKTYDGKDPNVISSIKKWDIRVVKGELQGAAEMRTVVRDLHLDVARMLGVEMIMVGGNDSAGTFGMVESKAALHVMTLQGLLVAIATATHPQLRRLMRANGLNPDKATPQLKAAPISTADVLKTAQTLAALNIANLHEQPEALAAMYDRMDLPYAEPDPARLMLPRIGVPDLRSQQAEPIAPQDVAPPEDVATQEAP
jgi:hypothetical protein